MSVASYTDVLEYARQLSLKDQVELAETLLRNLPARIQDESIDLAEGKLTPLTGMSVRELQVLLQAVVAPDHQEQLQALLAKNRRATLSADEQVKLKTLLAEADQVALLKARALYTLKISGLRRGLR